MAWFESSKLGKSFQRCFEVAPALTDELRNEVFGIRHRVFCEELGLEPKRTDLRERDEYDAHSIHLLMRSVVDEGYIGCARLVLARPGDPYYPLPFERACGSMLDRNLVDPTRVPRSAVAEVSRLGVVRSFRRRKGEASTADGVAYMNFGTEERPRFPYIQVGLYLGSVAIAQQYGIDTLFVLAEPKLATHFGKLGLKVRPVGAPIQSHGTQVPVVLDVKEIVAGLRNSMRPLYKEIVREIDAAYFKRRTLH